METVVVAALNGLVVGASLALVAAGLALLFGVLGVLNFAQGDFFMLGAYVVWFTLARGLSFWLGVVAAVVAVGLVCGLGLMVMLWPLRDRAHALVLLATLALSLILEQLASNVFGADAKSVAAPVSGHLVIGHTDYPLYDLLVILDDATSEIYYAQRVEQESTAPGMAALREGVDRKGLSVLCTAIGAAISGLPPRSAAESIVTG